MFSFSFTFSEIRERLLYIFDVKTYMQFIEKKESLESKDTKGLLQETLAVLRALSWSHYASHWQSKGSNFYGNHLLFQRLYEAVDDEFDTLAEKLVAYFGEEAVKMDDAMDRAKVWVEKWSKTGDVVDRALNAEQDLQRVLAEVYDRIKNSDDMSLGLDDYLMAVANTHETHLYLVQQVKR